MTDSELSPPSYSATAQLQGETGFAWDHDGVEVEGGDKANKHMYYGGERGDHR